MSFNIEIININDLAIESELKLLIETAFAAPDALTSNYLSQSLASGASKPSYFFVAEKAGQLIGCNAFVAYDFTLNGNSYTGYQSCFSATHPDHRGKGIFSAIINAAKEKLKAEGAGFIYGIPNDVSLPIFTGKLGFTEIPSVVNRLFKFPFLRASHFSNATINTASTCFTNELQVKDHKLMMFTNEIHSFQYNDSWLWGKLVRKKKWGISWGVFYVGGMQIAEGDKLKHLVKMVFKKHAVLFVQVVSCSNNSYNTFLKGWKPASMNGFIFYNLNMPECKHLNIMFGAIDVF